jgi:CRP-like cAMP-binding protein
VRWAGLARFDAGAGVPKEAFALLRSLPLFEALPLGTVENVSRRMSLMKCAPGEAIVREGESGERFFVIAEGKFDVTCEAGAYPPLADGDIFGEIALLRECPRTATVTARTDGTLYALDREAFQLVTCGHRFARSTAESMADERLERTPVSEGAG